jgi:hypothetical protein
MPTPQSHLSLSPKEKAFLVKWIEEGAEYQPHWAFVKPVKKPIPTDTIAKAAKTLPAGPETMFITLHISLTKTSLADDSKGKISAIRNRNIQKRVICRYNSCVKIFFLS